MITMLNHVNKFIVFSGSCICNDFSFSYSQINVPSISSLARVLSLFSFSLNKSSGWTLSDISPSSAARRRRANPPLSARYATLLFPKLRSVSFFMRHLRRCGQRDERNIWQFVSSGRVAMVSLNSRKRFPPSSLLFKHGWNRWFSRGSLPHSNWSFSRLYLYDAR